MSAAAPTATAASRVLPVADANPHQITATPARNVTRRRRDTIVDERANASRFTDQCAIRPSYHAAGVALMPAALRKCSGASSRA